MLNILMSVNPYDGDNGLLAFIVIMGILAVGFVYDHFISSRRYYVRKRRINKLRRQVLRYRKARYGKKNRVVDVLCADTDTVSRFVKNGDIVTLIFPDGEIWEYTFNSDESNEFFWLDNNKVPRSQMVEFLKESGVKFIRC